MNLPSRKASLASVERGKKLPLWWKESWVRLLLLLLLLLLLPPGPELSTWAGNAGEGVGSSARRENAAGVASGAASRITRPQPTRQQWIRVALFCSPQVAQKTGAQGRLLGDEESSSSFCLPSFSTMTSLEGRVRRLPAEVGGDASESTWEVLESSMSLSVVVATSPGAVSEPVKLLTKADVWELEAAVRGRLEPGGGGGAGVGSADRDEVGAISLDMTLGGECVQEGTRVQEQISEIGETQKSSY
jgi:hypothetical protein